jgi:hypothetical protein
VLTLFVYLHEIWNRFSCTVYMWFVFFYDLLHILPSYLTNFGYMECNVYVWVYVLCIYAYMYDLELRTAWRLILSQDASFGCSSKLITDLHRYARLNLTSNTCVRFNLCQTQNAVYFLPCCVHFLFNGSKSGRSFSARSHAFRRWYDEAEKKIKNVKLSHCNKMFAA